MLGEFLLAKIGMKKSEIAKKTGLHINTVSPWFDHQFFGTLKSFVKLSALLNKDLGIFISEYLEEYYQVPSEYRRQEREIQKLKKELETKEILLQKLLEKDS